MPSAPDENIIVQAWHSLEEALHIREPVPPPVPPKDEKWLIKTVNLSLPQDEPDPSFWDRIVQRITSLHSHSADDEQDEEAVSISVPAEEALRQLGVEADDRDIQAKKYYFERMAARCKEKFEQDKDLPIHGTLVSLDSEEGLDNSDNSRHRHNHLHEYFHALRRHLHHHNDSTHIQGKQHNCLMPKVDPKEMKAAHSIIYYPGKGSTDDNDDEEDRKLFGSWWGCHSRRSQDERQIVSRQESEWEIIDLPKSKKEKRQSFGEQNGAVSETFQRTENRKDWWKPKSLDVKGITATSKKNGQHHDRNAATKRHQAIAAAAAYEAVKEYQARKVRQGKTVSHGEMKAILAGMAMAEAIKILESRHDDDNEEERNETVAEAGSTALKLFELLR
ncbi:hypothetical protein BGZ46_006569 [Entomortierella lignicola]|nr:hypothetical protein BGZ46_006569 [Entomortierella lignicola]